MSQSRLFRMAAWMTVSIVVAIGCSGARAAEWTASADNGPAAARPIGAQRVADLVMLSGPAQPVMGAGAALPANAPARHANAATGATPAPPGAKEGGPRGALHNPVNWVLMVIGVGMIGGALRGFVVANRALARLQPEDLD